MSLMPFPPSLSADATSTDGAIKVEFVLRKANKQQEQLQQKRNEAIDFLQTMFLPEQTTLKLARLVHALENDIEQNNRQLDKQYQADVNAYHQTGFLKRLFTHLDRPEVPQYEYLTVADIWELFESEEEDSVLSTLETMAQRDLITVSPLPPRKFSEIRWEANNFRPVQASRRVAFTPFGKSILHLLMD